MELSKQYDHRALIKYGLTTLFLAATFRLSQGYMALALPLFALISVLNRKSIEILYWVLMLTLSSVANPAIFMRNTVTMVALRVTLVLLTGALAVKALNTRGTRVTALFWGIMPYMAWEMIVSLQGYSPIVSYLKLILFFCIFLAVMGVANEIIASLSANARILRAAVLSPIALMIIGSIALIPFPSLSLMVEKLSLEAMLSGEAVSLFCGMCAHSQAMGPMSGILATFVLADLVFSVRKWDPFYLLMLLCCPLIAWKTSSRTGMGTLIVGTGIVIFFFLNSHGGGRKWRTNVLSVLLLLVTFGVVALMTVPKLRERASEFAVKAAERQERTDVSVEKMFSSRQNKIDTAWYNFKKKPMLGNGFQVSEEMVGVRRRGLASYLAAPIEKGVWMYAILEEGGAVGMVLFCGWLACLFWTLYRRHAYITASVFFAFIVSNVGEFSIFAMSYVGGFYWTLTFIAAVLDAQCLKDKGLPVYGAPIRSVRAEVGMEEWTRLRG